MNVYEDEAGNPCGDCAYQPVSFYRGADAAEVAQKLSEAITRADDVWEVVSCEDGVLTVQEKGTRDSAGDPRRYRAWQD